MFKVGDSTRYWAKNLGLTCHYQATIESTNTSAKEFSTGNSSFLMVSENQTAGRGRGENTWANSNAGSCLLSSWGFNLKYAPQPIISPRIGLALFEAAMRAWPELNWALKAPNDLYVSNAKLAGLLIETVVKGAENLLVVGLGMNVFSAPNIPNAGFLQSHLPKEIDLVTWNQFLNYWWRNLNSCLGDRRQGELDGDEMNKLKIALNRYHEITSGRQEPYTEVYVDGSLQTNTKTISWKDL